jgi:cytochrome oxidase Cu insertion factor (SCO1/SenC/PrrC family)
MNEKPQAGPTRSNRTLIILVFVFIAPFLFAYIVHKFKIFQPGESKNFGEIVSPAQPLPDFSIKKITDEPFGLDDIRHKWVYIYFVKDYCDEGCQLNLVKMRNARLGQGADADRVRYYLVFTGEPSKQVVSDQFVKQHPRITVLYGGGSEMQAFTRVFQGKQGKPVDETRRVYMVDPIGNFMMFYEDGFEAIGIMEDLKHLLKWSQIG